MLAGAGDRLATCPQRGDRKGNVPRKCGGIARGYNESEQPLTTCPWAVNMIALALPSTSRRLGVKLGLFADPHHQIDDGSSGGQYEDNFDSFASAC